MIDSRVASGKLPAVSCKLQVARSRSQIRRLAHLYTAYLSWTDPQIGRACQAQTVCIHAGGPQIITNDHIVT